MGSSSRLSSSSESVPTMRTTHSSSSTSSLLGPTISSILSSISASTTTTTTTTTPTFSSESTESNEDPDATTLFDDVMSQFHQSLIDEHNCTDYGDISLPQHLLQHPNTDNITYHHSSTHQSINFNHQLFLHNKNSTSSSLSSPSNCTSAWDGLSCWYQTLSGHEAVIPCFSNLNGINYDTTQNASRLCLSNGTWAEQANYSRCKPLKMEQLPIEHLYTPSIYYVGYVLSLCALTVALWIFLYFKDLRCVRNTIHTNLMITYLLIAVCWITTDRLHSNPSPLSRKASCIIVILLTYLMGTNFFWMFVEGRYLYILVVKTFSIELVKIRNFIFIGWGLPGVVVLVWSVTKGYFTHYESLWTECPWQAQDNFDYIYKVPILAVLVVNIFFLSKIMWVLITKLRSATSAESKQYWKAAKALLVLIPLLGVGYILVLVTPTHPTAKLVFQYLQAILVSTQGFTVAVLYCFCNGDVRNSVRHHFQRFRLQRTLRYGADYTSTHSTYYRSTTINNNNNHNSSINNGGPSSASLMLHHNNTNGNGSQTIASNNNNSSTTTPNNARRPLTAGYRAAYAFRSLKGFVVGSNNSRNNNGSIKSTASHNGGRGNGSKGRFSNDSDSTSTVRQFRSSLIRDGGGGGCRDSSGSLTTNNSYLINTNSCGSPATTVAGAAATATPATAAALLVNNGNGGRSGGYISDSLNSSPETERLNPNGNGDESIDIELQPI